MREIFYEESAKIHDKKAASIKYNVLNAISILSWVMLFVWLYIFQFLPLIDENALLNIFIALIPAIGFVCSGFFFFAYKYKFYADYDYSFIGGELRVSKIVKETRCKQIISFSSSAIERIGKVGSETFNIYYKTKGLKKIVYTSNKVAGEGKDFYYLIINQLEKKLLILECSEELIKNILIFTKITVLEKDFK